MWRKCVVCFACEFESVSVCVCSNKSETEKTSKCQIISFCDEIHFINACTIYWWLLNVKSKKKWEKKKTTDFACQMLNALSIVYNTLRDIESYDLWHKVCNRKFHHSNKTKYYSFQCSKIEELHPFDIISMVKRMFYNISDYSSK